VNYLGGNMPTFALNFSRPGGEIICQYYNFLRLGKEGYREIQDECYQLGRFLAEKIAALGPFKIIYDGQGGIPGLCWELKDPASSTFTLYNFADRLRERGWLVPAYSMPPNREDLVIQRILIRHGFTRDMAQELLVEMNHALEHFDQHPSEPSSRLAAVGAESMSHDHSGR
jgi:glutamate decarboxylase